MKQLQKIIPYLFLLLPVIAFTQPADSIKTNLTGKWLMVKHTLTEKGRTDDLLTANEIYTFDFAGNGTYKVSYTNKKNNSTTVYKGKWQLVNAGKKLKLYDNNTIPAKPGRLVGDRLLPIIKLTATSFVTKELLFGMDLLGTSYYQRQ